MKIFINAGHAPNGIPDPGAVNNVTGDLEALLAKEASDLLKKYIEDYGYSAKVFQSDSLREICNESNAYNADVFISVHFNAFNTYAKGTETLYKSFNGQRLANSIQSRLIRALPTLLDRGVKQRDDLFVLNATEAVAALVELCFIDNVDDLAQYKANKERIIKAVANGIIDYLES